MSDDDRETPRPDTGVIKRGVEYLTAEDAAEHRRMVDDEYAYYEVLDEAMLGHEARLDAYYEALAAGTPGWSATALRELDADYDPLSGELDGDMTRPGIDRHGFAVEGERDDGGHELRRPD